MPSQADIALQAIAANNAAPAIGTQADQALAGMQEINDPNSANNKYRDESTSIGDRIGKMVYGAGMGASDLVNGVAQGALHLANSLYDKTVTPDAPKGTAGKFIQNISDQFDQHLKNQENQYQADTQGSGAAGLGRLGTNVAPFLVAPEAAATTKAEGLGQALLGYGKSAIQGGVFGASQPVNDIQKNQDGLDNYWNTKSAQSEIGAGGSILGKFLGNRLASIINPSVDPSVQNLINQGVTPTPGQLLGGGMGEMENKLTSLPFAGNKISNAQNNATISFNNAALNRGADPGNPYSTKIGQEGIADAQNNYFAPRYDQLLSQMTHAPDGQFAQDILNSAANNRVPKSGMDEITNFMHSKYAPLFQSTSDVSPALTGQDVKTFQTQLRQVGNSFSKSQDPIDQRIGQTYSDIQDAFKNSLARQNDPDLVGQLNNLDRQYANFSTYKNASVRAGAANREGNISPSDYIGAILGNAKKTGDVNSFAGGNAYNQQFANDAKSVIGNRYPDSGTAGRTSSSAIIPLAAGATLFPVTSTLYSDAGQKALAALLTKRPAIAPAISNYVQQSAPVLGAATIPGTAQALAQLLNYKSN